MRPLLFAAAGAGFAGVALGAFGAHALEGRLNAEADGWWETATFYGLVHALAAAFAAREGARLAALAFLIGCLLFSGSLYVLALTSLGDEPMRILGAITPFGGVAFLAGWTFLAWAALRR